MSSVLSLWQGSCYSGHLCLGVTQQVTTVCYYCAFILAELPFANKAAFHLYSFESKWIITTFVGFLKRRQFRCNNFLKALAPTVCFFRRVRTKSPKCTLKFRFLFWKFMQIIADLITIDCLICIVRHIILECVCVCMRASYWWSVGVTVYNFRKPVSFR